MNTERRTRLKELHNRITQLGGELDNLRDEEQEAFDSMPESLQTGARGEKIEDGLGELANSVSSLDDAASALEDFFS
jgi:hypothetical protein